jgi:uncharacterized membrane protein YdjX (TVP38/TMEM64 family)
VKPNLRLARLALLAAVVALISVVAWRLGYFDMDGREAIASARRGAESSPFAPVLFVGAWALAVLLCLPTTILTLVGGALFGFGRGAFFAWSGALLGTGIAHSIARWIGPATITRLFGGHRIIERLGQRSDLRTLIPLRVLPLAPFGVLDYVTGIAGVPLRSVLLATALGMAPATLAYAFAGEKLGAGLSGSGGEARHALLLAGAVSLLVSGTAVVAWLIRRRR